MAAAQWLSLRLQVLAAAVITLVAALGVAGNEGLLPSIATQACGCVSRTFQQEMRWNLAGSILSASSAEFWDIVRLFARDSFVRMMQDSKSQALLEPARILVCDPVLAACA